MSHYTVLVTNTNKESVDSQLEPYYEQGEDGDYFMKREIELYAKDIPAKAEKIVNDYLKDHKKAVKDRRAAKRAFRETDDWADDRLKETELERQAKYDNHYLVAYEKAKAELEAGNALEIVKEWYGYDVDEDGNLFYVTNPDAKWDWYSVGGRWSGYFKLKRGAKGELGKNRWDSPKVRSGADIALVKDIDWAAMKRANRKFAEKRWAQYEKDKADGKDPMHPGAFLTDSKKSKEEYLKDAESVATFAVLHNDEWYERGSMGWWAVVSDEKPSESWDEEFDKIVTSLNSDSEVTIVDCHI